jgi:D-serine ammonia-lyase
LDVELHAGVYPLLDLQQLATHARPPHAGLTYSSMALRIMVEVASIYPHRKNPEALIAAGTLVLGREPCPSYQGWGVVTPWSEDLTKRKDLYDFDGNSNFYDPDQPPDRLKGWSVSRISQEHGILTWEGPKEEMRKIEIGEKLLIWPNHACIAGAGFGWYFVVDSATKDPDVVRDIWVRCKAW